jgi:hypothetical protein
MLLLKGLFLLAFLFASEKTELGELVSVAVGQLKGRVVTSREVNISYFVESVLYGKKGLPPKSFLPVKSRRFSREVTAVLIEWVVYLESKGFEATKVAKGDEQAALKRFSQASKKNALWKKLGVTEQELKSLVSRKLQAKKFVRFKVDSSVVPITDDEVKEYFEQNRLKFGNLPFENFKENIRNFLSRQQVDRRLKDWFDVLQTKYKVSNFVSEAGRL